ncbi:MAG TPA: 4-alpha-glucanotransferase, partial [Candidatus Binatia bacterium]|nr:4-alpha-glucanotransferase [Candidatus Binatia bacterium]
VVSTLPLLASFLDEPFNPSPYAPASRLFWNEFYLDVTRIPEFRRCPVARAVLNSASFQTDLQSQRASPLVDYRALMALKRRVLEELLRCLLAQPGKRRTSFQHFVETHPVADDYAAFRAKTERERTPWTRWHEASRDGTLACGDYDQADKQYHLYVQWQADEQMRTLAEKTKREGPAVYLDFPLGVNRDGYDVWRQRSVFASAASGGAPPDMFFTKGQDWGFPPLHPEGLRKQGYRYYIDCLRHHLQYAGMLRIDHVMALHRLFWIPEGFEPSEGMYVRYPAEEFYAVLNLESHRHRAEIVGENLGTVPPYTNTTMAKHKIFGMYVGEFGIPTQKGQALEQVRSGTVASIDTHDTPTFAGFWSGSDIEDRRDLGLLTDAQSAREHQTRATQRETLIKNLKAQGWLDQEAPDAAAVLKAWLCDLSAGAADVVLVNLEDLWLEPFPQNVPGTWQERPNWRRRARYRFDEIRRLEPVVDILSTVNDVRKKKG